MKKVRIVAITSVIASLGLLVGACYQEPAESEDAPAGTVESGPAVSAEPEAASEGAGESVDTDAQALEEGNIAETEESVWGVCRVRGSWCRADWQCCSGSCVYGVCRGWGGGGPVCRYNGSWCRGDWQCCSGSCVYGVCRGGWGW